VGTRTAAIVLAVAVLLLCSCGKYGPPRRATGRTPARPAPTLERALEPTEIPQQEVVSEPEFREVDPDQEPEDEPLRAP
jgi:hypothetical protein